MTPAKDRSLVGFFSDLRDPRVVGRSRHLLSDIVLIAKIEHRFEGRRLPQQIAAPSFDLR